MERNDTGVKKRCTVIDELGKSQYCNLLRSNDFLKGMTVALADPRSLHAPSAHVWIRQLLVSHARFGLIATYTPTGYPR